MGAPKARKEEVIFSLSWNAFNKIPHIDFFSLSRTKTSFSDFSFL